MHVLIITGILAIILALPCFNRKKSIGLKLGFVIITVVAAIRYDYGSDFWSYYEVFNQITYAKSTFSQLMDLTTKVSDPGWNVFCYIFRPFGFSAMIAVISIITNICYYKLISNYVPIKYYSMAMFLYLFDWSIYPIQLSMLRQGLAICAFVFAYRYIELKKLLRAFIILLVAATIHKSVLIVMPFVFLHYMPERLIKHATFACLLLFVFFMIGTRYMSSLYEYFMVMDAFEGYSYAENNSDSQFGIKNTIHLLPRIATCLVLYTKKIKLSISKVDICSKSYLTTIYKPSYIMLLSCIGVIFMPFSSIAVLISRFAFYFNTFNIVAFPYLWDNIKNPIVKYVLAFLIILVLLVEYDQFFHSPIYKDMYYHYHTIFEH